MKQEILVNVTSRETRAALVDDGIVQEVYLERATKRGLIGNIYRGKVSRVLPGMQAAFIDIGLQRTAFLHESDIERPVIEDNGPARKNSVSIRNLVTEGGEILVQVLKDPLGSKGARLTTCITIPSRYLVYMPGGTGIGVSVRIENETERDRLRALVSDFSGADKKGGYIVRTAAEGADKVKAAVTDAIKFQSSTDIKFLITKPMSMHKTMIELVDNRVSSALVKNNINVPKNDVDVLIIGHGSMDRNAQLSIKYVEDGLSEWLNPEWFTSKPAVLPQTLSIQRFPKIEPSYVPQIIPLYPENDEGIMNRMGKVTHKLLSEYKDDLLIVTHGAPIVGIIQELIDREKEVSCPLCSLFKVVKTDQRWVLELNGDTSHLIHTEENVRLH